MLLSPGRGMPRPYERVGFKIRHALEISSTAHRKNPLTRFN